MIAPNEHDVIRSVRSLICQGVEIYPDTNDGFAVDLPFTFEDGDRYVIILRRDADGWYVTDDGHTMSRLGVETVDVHAGQRGVLLESSLRFHGVSHAADGELRIRISGERIADGLFGLAQAITEVASLPKFTHEMVRSTFIEDLSAAVAKAFTEERVIPDWVNPDTDAEGIYPVDYRVETAGAPLYIFATNNENRARQAIISTLHHKETNGAFFPVAVSEDESTLPVRVRAQLRDAFPRRVQSRGDLAALTDGLRSLVTSGKY